MFFRDLTPSYVSAKRKLFFFFFFLVGDGSSSDEDRGKEEGRRRRRRYHHFKNHQIIARLSGNGDGSSSSQDEGEKEGAVEGAEGSEEESEGDFSPGPVPPASRKKT
jgi:hypothetical protein